MCVCVCVCYEIKIILQISYVEKVKDIECEKESEVFSHSGFRIDNESETSTFSGLIIIR